MLPMTQIFLKERNLAWHYAFGIVFSVAPILYCAVDDERHSHFSRAVLTLFALAVVICLSYILYCETGLSERFSDFTSLTACIRDCGVWGMAIFIGLTIFQVVVLPVPEAVTILLGVAIYGATISFVLSVIGTMIGSLISFALGKVFGRRLCNWIFGKDNTEKYARLLNDKGRFLFVIMLLFPAFPDDMLCTIAGITAMSYAYFFVACLVTRPVMIGLTAYLGSGVIPFSGRGIPVWVAIACIMFVAFVAVGRIRSLIENRRKTD